MTDDQVPLLGLAENMVRADISPLDAALDTLQKQSGVCGRAPPSRLSDDRHALDARIVGYGQREGRRIKLSQSAPLTDAHEVKGI